MLGSIGQWISEHITEPLQNMIIDSVNAVFVTWLNSVVDMVTQWMGNELALIAGILENSYIQQAVTYSVAMAAALLVARVAFNAFRTYMLYSTGQENHPGELLRNAAVSAAMIVTSPWIATQALTFSLSVVDDIMGFQAVPSVKNISEAVTTLVFSSTGLINFGLMLVLLFGFVMCLLLFIQVAVRAVNVAILMIVGPWMWALQNELGASWFKSLLGQCLSIPVQMFLLRGALGSLASVGAGVVTGPLLFIGFLWAAIKFPAFLQQIVAQTGVGGAIGGIAQHAGTAVFVRRMAIRR